MAQPVTKLRIFVGSPGDTTPERDAVGKIIEELNITTADPKHLVLELVRWETHVWPGFDRTAQEVINKRIGAYDIFIGIMWNRLGTPTGDAASGTVEEFDRAYRRWLTHKQPKLFYYFNNKPFNPTSADDLRQKGDVLAFKDSLRAIGGLYYDYNGIDEFKDFARRHIALEVGQFTPSADDFLRTPMPELEHSFPVPRRPKKTHTLVDDSKAHVETMYTVLNSFRAPIQRIAVAVPQWHNPYFERQFCKLDMTALSIVFPTFKTFCAEIRNTIDPDLHAIQNSMPKVRKSIDYLREHYPQLTLACSTGAQNHSNLCQYLQTIRGTLAQLGAASENIQQPVQWANEREKLFPLFESLTQSALWSQCNLLSLFSVLIQIDLEARG